MRKLTQKEHNFIRFLNHIGYTHIECVIPERWRNIHVIRASNKCGRELDFSDTIFLQLSPLDGKVLITDFLEGNI